jgi:hypothetical protein
VRPYGDQSIAECRLTYPSLHVHVKDPAVSAHNALTSQLCRSPEQRPLEHDEFDVLPAGELGEVDGHRLHAVAAGASE